MLIVLPLDRVLQLERAYEEYRPDVFENARIYATEEYGTPRDLSFEQINRYNNAEEELKPKLLIEFGDYPKHVLKFIDRDDIANNLIAVAAKHKRTETIKALLEFIGHYEDLFVLSVRYGFYSFAKWLVETKGIDPIEEIGQLADLPLVALKWFFAQFDYTLTGNELIYIILHYYPSKISKEKMGLLIQHTNRADLEALLKRLKRHINPKPRR